MLLQIGLGLSAFRTGVIMAASGAGALAMKFLVQRILRRAGFRTVLVSNGIILAIIFMVPAWFGADWAPTHMMAALCFGGFLQSMQMVCVNALAYADIDQDRMSAATTTAAMCQQLVQSMGVALAAALLGLLQTWHGTHILSAQVVAPTFVAMGIASAISLFWFVRLPADAGAEMRGR